MANILDEKNQLLIQIQIVYNINLILLIIHHYILFNNYIKRISTLFLENSIFNSPNNNFNSTNFSSVLGKVELFY